MAKITEAFDNKRRELGEVKFSETSLKDPHVVKILDQIVKDFGIPRKELEDGIQEKLDKFDEIAKKSPILYDTIRKNAIEQEVFDLVEKHKIGKDAPRFSVQMFSKLLRFIKAEHDQFFPLRNFIDSKYLYNPVIIMVPSNKKEYEKYNNVDTAAATPKGEFIFCVPFMQKLIDYAFLKDIKPKGKKYKCNGGEIPDVYAYIEFLIIHEFMHYTYADFHYQKTLKANPKIINWVGDFRTNYLLVKSGLEQLPIGLFNDQINYDRQKSYKEMYDLVEAEFKKLNKDEQKQVQDALDGMGDNHDSGGEPGEPGEGEGKPSSGSGEPKEGDKGDDKNGDIFDEMDKNNEDIEKKIGGGKEVSSEDKAEKPDPNKPMTNGSGAGEGRGGRGGKGDGDGSKFDYSKVRPTFTWKKLLDRMITDASTSSEETFQKPHRRNITGVHLAQQTGAGAMKPGEVPLENELKLGFVVDTSGSMTGVVPTIYSNIENLLKTKQNASAKEFYLIKFSGNHYIYKCNYKANRYRQLAAVDDKSAKMREGSVKELFSKHIGAATNFTDEMTADIELLAKKKYNILIMSDSDILYDENFANVKKLVTEQKNVFFILDSRDTFIRMAEMLKQISRNITYFE